MSDISVMEFKSAPDSSVDKIWAHYKNPKKHKLTAKQEKVKERWLAAWTAMIELKNKTEVVKILRGSYKISRAQAFKDIRSAEKLYGNVLKADHLGQMALLYEYAFKGFRECIKKGDLKNAKGFHDNMMKCVGEEKDISFNPQKLENNQIRMSISKEVSNAIVMHLKSGVLDFNDMTVDAEYLEEEADEED